MKRIAFGIIAAALLAGCSRGITNEQYIGAMAALGCKGAGVLESTPEGAEILKAQGVTVEQLVAFRKKIGNPHKMMPLAKEIAIKVMACRGLAIPAQQPAPPPYEIQK